MTPIFPIRLIFDDGECRTIDTPEDLLDSLGTIDTADPRVGVWARDALDRTVLLRMQNGFVESLEAI